LKMFFRQNAFINNNLMIRGIHCPIEGLRTPAFMVGTVNDHIVPWRAIFAGQGLFNKSTFVLGESGHVAGIINPPNQGKYGFWYGNTGETSCDKWQDGAQKVGHSWWTQWLEWLKPHLGTKTKAHKAPSWLIHEKAPGRYATMPCPKVAG